MRRNIFISILCLLLGLGAIGQEKQNNFEISKSIDIYNSLLRELNLNYVDEIDPGELNETAIDAMLKEMDPYTVFIPESEIENYKLMTTGEYGGIGALIQYDGEYTRISDPYEGWPAQKAGLQAGDAILSVNGVDTHQKTTEQVSELLKGQPGTEVTLKIRRYGVDKPIEKTLKREKVKIDNIPYATVFDNGIAYISLSGFTREAGKEMKEKLVGMKKDHDLKGVVIDLRGNGGGLLNEAVDIVNLFVPKGKPVVSMKGKTATANSLHSTLGRTSAACHPRGRRLSLRQRDRLWRHPGLRPRRDHWSTHLRQGTGAEHPAPELQHPDESHSGQILHPQRTLHPGDRLLEKGQTENG